MKPMSIRVPRLAKVIMKLVVCIADKAAFAGKSTSNALISIPLTQAIIFERASDPSPAVWICCGEGQVGAQCLLTCHQSAHGAGSTTDEVGTDHCMIQQRSHEQSLLFV